MRRAFLYFFLLVVLIIGLSYLARDERIASNLGSAFSDSIQELNDRTVGKAQSEAQTLSDHAQDNVSNTASAFHTTVEDAEQGMVDTSITAAVKMKMINDDVVPGSAINVKTNNGVVLLTGSVNRTIEAERAAELAWKADGVRGVISKILVAEAWKTEGGNRS